MISGQGHENVAKYILQALYFICPKCLWLSKNGFNMTNKSGGGGGDGNGNGRWRPPRQGWLITMTSQWTR